jgi:hypothetical protein
VDGKEKAEMKRVAGAADQAPIAKLFVRISFPELPNFDGGEVVSISPCR